MRRGSWILLFMVTQVAFTSFEQMNHNTSSRLAAMSAFCRSPFQEGAWEWGPRSSWSDDWATSKTGERVSNKAPGAQWLALPLSCALERGIDWVLGVPHGVQEQADRSWRLRYIANLILSLLLQLVPAAVAVAVWHRWAEKNRSADAAGFALIALLFGTTPAWMLNLWVGHGVLILWVALALWGAWSGRAWAFFTGLAWAQLTEYSSVLLFPGFFFLAWSRKEEWKIRWKGGSQMGGTLALIALPVGLWVYYHTQVFGGVLQIANRFQNPLFRDQAQQAVQLWGIFSLPSPRVALKLLLGWERGILFSQPCVLWGWGIGVWAWFKGSRYRAFHFAVVSGAVGLLAMNAAFGGWHGGPSAGPRYLSAALPWAAISVYFEWDNLTVWARRLGWGLLTATFFTYAGSKIVSVTGGLWVEWLDYFRTHTFAGVWRTALLVVLMVAVYLGDRFTESRKRHLRKDHGLLRS